MSYYEPPDTDDGPDPAAEREYWEQAEREHREAIRRFESSVAFIAARQMDHCGLPTDDSSFGTVDYDNYCGGGNVDN